MKLGLKKLVSAITAAAISASMAVGVIADDLTGSKVYEFDASTINDLDNTANAVANAGNYGFEFDSTGTVWSPMREESTSLASVQTEAVRFSTRSKIGDKDIMKMVFANDTVNNPNAATLDGKKYTVEMEFAAHYYDDGNLYIDFIGNTDSGENSFARLRVDYQGETANKATMSFVDNDGNVIGSPSAEYTMNYINDKKQKSANTLHYLKAEFNFETDTFSAWITPRKTTDNAYTEAPADDTNRIVSDQPINVTGIESLAGIKGSVTNSVHTNGLWLKYLGIEESEQSEPIGSNGYELDASTINDLDTSANAVANAGKYGFEFDASGTVWAPIREEATSLASVQTESVRFSTRSSIGDKDLMKLVFAKDSVNNPTGKVMTGKKYTMEMEFAAHYYNDGNMYIDFIGNTDSGENSFARLRVDYQGETANKAAMSFVDNDGNVIGSPSAEYTMNYLDSANRKTANTLHYLKAEFDFETDTFSAWITPRKTTDNAYTEAPADDTNKIVSDQPINVTGIENFVGIKGSITGSVTTNGLWIKYVGVSGDMNTPTPDSTSTPTPSLPTPTPEPGVETLIDEENFAGKTVSSNTLDGWSFYDKGNAVTSLSNNSLTLSGNKLTIKKTSVEGETDYAEKYQSMYRFKEVIEAYSDTERTSTYRSGLTGKYKIETSVKPYVQAGSQFQVFAPAFGDEGSSPARAYPMCVDANTVYEYISSTSKPVIYSSSINNKDTKITYTVDTDAGELITKVENGSEYKKTIDKGVPLQGMMYILKSQAKANDAITVNNIKLYRTGGSSTSGGEAAEAAKKLLISDLTDTPEAVSENLKSLPSSVDGAGVSWSSSNESMISSSTGALLDQPIGGSQRVILTAIITKDDDKVYKDFYLDVVSLDLSAFKTIYEADFTGDMSEIEISENGATHSVKGKSLVLSRPKASSSSTVNIYPSWGGERFNGKGTMMLEADVTMPKAYQKMEMALYDSSGSRITSFYTRAKSTTTDFTGVGRDELTGAAVHKDISTAGYNKALAMKMNVLFNLDTSRMTMNVQINNGESITLFENKYIRENASKLSYIQILAVSDDNQGTPSLFGDLSINSIKLLTTDKNKLSIADSNMAYSYNVETLGRYIKNDVELKTDTYEGTTINWTSSNPQVLSNDGKLDNTAYSDDTPITLTYRLELNGTGIFIEKSFDLTAVYVDPNNIVIGRPVESKFIAMTGHGPEKAIDGSKGSYWQTMRFADKPSFTVTLDEEQVINSIAIYEAPMAGEYPITGYSIEVSRDNKTWKTVYTGTTLGDQKVEASITPTLARYVRFSVKNKNDSLCCGLYEFQVFGPITDEEKVKSDIVYVLDKIGVLTNITSNVTLPTMAKYGSTITYSSSIPDYFSNTGVVNRDSNSIKSGKLTIKAVNGTAEVEQEETITVAKKETGGGGGGGGSSSSSGGGGGSSSVMPAPPVTVTASPQPTRNPDTGIFNDVAKSFWGYDYIENLANKGVVSGDENKNFRPNENISRQEFVKMLLSALNIDTNTTTTLSFNDVLVTDWSYPYIAKAVELGIVNGISDDEFGKNGAITREDMAVMCVRALKSVGKYTETDVVADFADMNEVSDYAVEAVSAMSSKGIINGYEDKTFGPKNSATRAEAAKILYMLAN